MDEKPVIEGAPGLVWRRRVNGWCAEWQCRTDIAKAGFEPKYAHLWSGPELSDEAINWITDRCRRLQDEMLVWSRGGIQVVSTFDGTIAGLVNCYQTDPDSGFRGLRWKTRDNYTHLCNRIVRDHGDEALSDIRARNVLRWHEDWTSRGVAMAHSLVGMMRTLVSYGATFHEDEQCLRLKGVLSSMRFKMPKGRQERITAEQISAVRAMAHQMGRPSIALAQAFQFEAMLRQKDCIGEWVPSSEPGLSEITAGNSKWLRGLRWSEIDGNLILKHVTSKRQKEIEIDLKLLPMVMEELPAVLPRNGPVVVCEFTGIPWTAQEFRRWWRKVADACGIPRAVFNMDSRAGAISEATDAGAELEHVRHAATHGDIAMTQRYSRGSVEKVANVARVRVAHRRTKQDGA